MDKELLAKCLTEDAVETDKVSMIFSEKLYLPLSPS